MLLSKLILNSKTSQVRSDLGNPHKMHKTIMRAFPLPLPAGERVLFRIESQTDSSELPSILVQSQSPPNWQAVEEKYMHYFAQPVQIKKFEQLKLQKGQVLRFRLRANPTKRQTLMKADQKESKRIPLYHEQEHITWLARKGAVCGFELLPDALWIKPYPQRVFLIDGSSGRHRATFNIIDFEGLLRVSDIALLLKSIQTGIGPAKGMGCGLLSLARA